MWVHFLLYCALANRFVEADSGGDADVEAIYCSSHGEADEDVTVFLGESSEAWAFCAHYDSEWSFEVCLVE